MFLYLHLLRTKEDSVAQLVEHYTFNVVVLGSNPSGITGLGPIRDKLLEKGAFFV